VAYTHYSIYAVARKNAVKTGVLKLMHIAIVFYQLLQSVVIPNTSYSDQLLKE